MIGVAAVLGTVLLVAVILLGLLLVVVMGAGLVRVFHEEWVEWRDERAAARRAAARREAEWGPAEWRAGPDRGEDQ